MKGSYRFVDHTADRRLRVRGETKEELYRGALSGLRELLDGDQQDTWSGRSEKKMSCQITLEAGDSTLLLLDFLSEVLTLSHIEKAIFTGVEFSELQECKLQATLFGRRVEGFAEEVKAVTYHEADLVRNAEGEWETTIIFDI